MKAWKADLRKANPGIMRRAVSNFGFRISNLIFRELLAECGDVVHFLLRPQQILKTGDWAFS